MTEDSNKSILITYNHLNLPVTVTKSEYEVITYTYDATGVKLSKSVLNDENTTVTNYANNFIYKDGNLEFFSHPEGYIQKDESGKYFDYVYQYKDHLGNIRVSYTDSNDDNYIDATTEIVEENNYYPFGLKHKGYNNNVSANSNSVASKFKYNGIELEESLGIDWYEMDMRQYDPAIARWTSIDPVTHFQQSTYTAFDNNPVYWTDPSGTTSVQDLIGEASKNKGVVFTSNGDGTFSGNGVIIGEKQDPIEGATRPQMVGVS